MKKNFLSFVENVLIKTKTLYYSLLLALALCAISFYIREAYSDRNVNVIIVGYSHVIRTDYGRLVCGLNGHGYYVDSVLTVIDGVKYVESPEEDCDVTAYISNINIGMNYYKGHVSKEVIKDMYSIIEAPEWVLCLYYGCGICLVIIYAYWGLWLIPVLFSVVSFDNLFAKKNKEA